MANAHILHDFHPYTWYAISLYPTHARLASYESAPLVDLLIKRYNAKTDKFEYFKVENASYHHRYGGADLAWCCLEGHRPIALMHDGEDLPRWDAKNLLVDAVSNPPNITDITISQEAWKREKFEEEANALHDAAHADETHILGEAGALAFPEGTSNPPRRETLTCDVHGDYHLYDLDTKTCDCGANRDTESAVETGR